MYILIKKYCFSKNIIIKQHYIRINFKTIKNWFKGLLQG